MAQKKRVQTEHFSLEHLDQTKLGILCCQLTDIINEMIADKATSISIMPMNVLEKSSNPFGTYVFLMVTGTR